MNCLSASPSSTISGAISACDDQCIYEALNCHDTPAWELYDQQICNPEQALFASLSCEFTDIAGQPIEVRILIHPQDDRLWGEDPNAHLSDPMYTKSIFDPSEETSILNMWGIVADDTMQYIVIPKTTWNRDIAPIYTSTPELTGRPPRPMAGDIIKTIFNNRNYEIVDVGEEGSIFQGVKTTWDLIVKPYRFSEQSDQHREVHLGITDDPFETITTTPCGLTATQNNYATVVYGDNEFIEDESDKIDDYRDVTDPDKGAFGY